MDPDLHGLRYGIEKSIRYHQRRRAFMEGMHRFLMFAVIALGSGAISDMAAEFGFAKWLSVGAAVLAAVDLATGIGVRARDYAVLAGKFSALLAEIIRTPDPSRDQICEWMARRTEIEAEEPPVFWAVEADCYNEIALLRGNRDSIVEIPWWRWLLADVWRQDGFNPQRPAPAVPASETRELSS